MPAATSPRPGARRGPGPWLNLLGLATLILMAVGLFGAFVYAPPDAVQGQPQRIFYIHVPMAWVAYLAFFVVFVASIVYLATRNVRWDILARASAEVGVVFTTLVLITGSLWGKPIWGTWWTWDARLTSTLVLWLVYVAYWMLRSSVEDERGARFAAILGIVGFVDVPLTYFAVLWWRTLHPAPVVGPAGGGLPPAMLQTLLVCLLAVTLLYVYIMVARVRLEAARERLADLRAQLENTV